MEACNVGTRFHLMPALLVVVASSHLAAGQNSSSTAGLLDRFSQLSPKARLQLVNGAKQDHDFAAVMRQDFVQTVVERGVLDAIDVSDVVCRVRAGGAKFAPATTIKWVIDDGAAVKKDQRLLELDDTFLKVQLAEQKKQIDQAQAALNQAEKKHQLVKRDMQIEIRLGEIEIQSAALELKKNAGATAEQREILELRVEKAKLHLERATAQFRARVAKAETELAAKRTEVELETARAKGIEEEIRHCIMTAPRDGMAIYYIPEQTRLGGGLQHAIVAQGEPVREGQKLLRVVGLKQMAVQTRVHEALVTRVRAGQIANVRVDAYPQKTHRAKVHDVAKVASQADWLSANIKVYATRIDLLDEMPGLKPGMSAEVRIETARKPKVVQAPVEAVVRAGKDHYCYVLAGQELQQRRVVVGLNNDLSVEINGGLQEGEQVLRDPRGMMRRLAPLLDKTAPPPAQE